VDHGPGLPRLRPPRSSLAVGRRFRLLAKAPLIGAGTRPRVPSGLVARGRSDDPMAAAESPHEKFLLLPQPGAGRSRDVAWAEARWAADMASEDALLLSMMLPTETAPERKQEAQRMHDRALKLFQRVDALGPSGVGDPRSLASDVRSALQPVLDLLRACRAAQEEGTLQSLAWPSLLRCAEEGLAASLDRIDAAATGAPMGTVASVASTHAPRLARLALVTAHLLDPLEGAWTGRFRDVARRLDLAGGAPAGADEAFAAAVSAWTDCARAVEGGQVQSILNPMLADHLRREAVKALDDVRQARSVADREA
jgi:hypothetical protein